jgi:hypothetical protein
MPRIHTVAQDGTITAGDKLIGSDGDPNNGYVTRNYTVGGISNYVLGGTNAGSFTTVTTTGNGTIGGNLSVTGNLIVTGNATISGNLTFGDADTDTVSFSADVNSHVIPDVTNTYDLGASDKIWRNVYADNVEGYLKSADAATTYLPLVGGTLTGGLIGTTAAFTGDIQLGDATTDAASEIKAYGELGLRADSDNDTGYSYGEHLFRTRFGNAGGTQVAFNINQYDGATLLDPDTIFDTIEVGDVIYNLGTGSNYQSNTDETIASVDGFYNSSDQFVSATDSTGAAYFRVTMSNPVSYSANSFLTVLPAGETFVSGGGASSIKFYADTTTIGTLNESLFSIPGKATIGAFTIPNTIGSAEQVLRVPSSGTELEWADVSTTGITFKGTGTDFTDSLFVGHDTTGTLNQANKNLAVGYEALQDLTSGDTNVALGYAAGANNTVGGSNVFAGAQAGESVTKSIGSVYVGSFAGRLINDSGSGGNVGAYNTLIGYRSGYGVSGSTTHLAINNTAVGAETLEGITTGRQNAVIGAKAGEAISTGYGNVLIGFEAGKTLQTGTENIIIGTQCLSNINEGYDGIIAIGKNMSEAGISNNTTKIGHSSTSKAEILALYKTAEYANGGGNITISSGQSGSIYHLNSTTDGVFTLPNTVGIGAGMQIDFVLTALPATTEHKIVCNSIGANKLIGSLTIIDVDSGNATTHVSAQVSDNYIAIKLNGSTTGIVGSKVRLTSISSQKWLVEGIILVTGTPGNPFSTS